MKTANLPTLDKQALEYIGVARLFLEALRRRGKSQEIICEAWRVYCAVRHLAWEFAPNNKSQEFADWVTRQEAEHAWALKAAGLEDET